MAVSYFRNFFPRRKATKLVTSSLTIGVEDKSDFCGSILSFLGCAHSREYPKFPQPSHYSKVIPAVNRWQGISRLLKLNFRVTNTLQLFIRHILTVSVRNEWKSMILACDMWHPGLPSCFMQLCFDSIFRKQRQPWWHRFFISNDILKVFHGYSSGIYAPMFYAGSFGFIPELSNTDSRALYRVGCYTSCSVWLFEILAGNV